MGNAMVPTAAHFDVSMEGNREYVRSLARLSAGAILFSLPILATMEMWRYGFYLPPLDLAQFLLVSFVVLVGLSRVSGFEETRLWLDDLLDTFAAFAVGAVWASLILWVFGVIQPGRMPLREIAGDIVMETIPACFGGMLATKFLKSGRSDDQPERRSYWGQLLIMLGGALFFGFDVGPTEEMILVSFRMGPWHSIVLMMVSLFLLHVLVYSVGFTGERRPAGPRGFWSEFIRFSLAGYGVVVLVGLYLLWTFERLQGNSWPDIAGMVAVIAFPASIGAALSRTLV